MSQDVSDRARDVLVAWHDAGWSLARIADLAHVSTMTVSNAVAGRHVLSHASAVTVLTHLPNTPRDPCATCLPRPERVPVTDTCREVLRRAHDAGSTWGDLARVLGSAPTTLARIAEGRTATSDAGLVSRIEALGTRGASDPARRQVLEACRERVMHWHDVCGMGYADIAHVTRISKQGVADIARGHTESVREDTARAILSLPKSMRRAHPKRMPADGFVADVDRWVAAGISYRTMMFCMSGISRANLCNRHGLETLPYDRWSAWQRGRRELDKIAQEKKA